MIDFYKCDLPAFWEDCREIFDEFEREQMPEECYGWRSWKIERAFEKHSNGQLKWQNGKGYDYTELIESSKKVEWKQVKDAFKKDVTPTVILKNFRTNCIRQYDKTFDYLIVIDVERETLGVFQWDYVHSKSIINDATITAQLEISKAQLYTQRGTLL
tara:strand:+ start:125 stop:598 length:474 start_codon:yes stop_codon:yes gene_type:complete